ncbi:MAG TPA: sulfite exporter TauE/SafE family protein [Stellaceae bacterium]|nr:sulfite exporter TauE/SafE family protein [Stellaceae bacterium]
MGFVAIGLLALTSGVLIGGIAVGGVVLVPGLTLLGVPIHVSVAAAMLAMLFSGAIATAIFARRGSIDWPSAGRLSLGAAPAAFAGAIAGNHATPLLLGAVIGVTVIFAGWRVLRRGAGDESREGLAPGLLVLIGVAIGFASALTGTSGPVLLVPLLIWLDLPILRTVGMSQAIQLPITLMATLGNLASGAFDPAVTAVATVGVVLGSWVGARMAHALSVPLLTRIVGVVLLGVGGLLILRSATG